MTNKIFEMHEGEPPLTDVNGRNVIYSCVTGSYNYGLNEESSDKDYHLLVMPSMDDLYNARMFVKSETTSTLDYTAWDFRKLPEQLWKSNPNVLEMLFSYEVSYPMEACREPMEKLIGIRDSIACMNLPYLFSATMGIAHNEIKDIDRGCQDLLQEFGYNTKKAMHAYRVLSNLEAFAENGFRGFNEVIHCTQARRDELLAIKHGETYKDMADAQKVLGDYRLEIEREWKKAFLSEEPNRVTQGLVERLCREMFDTCFTTNLREA